MSSSGYILIEQRHSQPPPPPLNDGLHSDPIERGLLDFLRELAQPDFPYPKYSQLTVTGLEEVLYAARPHQSELAQSIHRRLNRVAAQLEQRLILVEVRILRGQIVRKSQFVLTHRGEDLPLHIIFDTPTKAADGDYYQVSAHLS